MSHNSENNYTVYRESIIVNLNKDVFEFSNARFEILWAQKVVKNVFMYVYCCVDPRLSQ